MTKLSFFDDLVFNETKVKTKVITETSFSKEIRILMQAGQIMKEHQTAFPILIHILEGSINLGAYGSNTLMKAGDIVALASHVPHDLKANEKTIIRLTLSKLDQVERVEKVINT